MDPGVVGSAMQCPDTLTNSQTKQLPLQTPQGLPDLIPKSLLITVISSSMIAQFQYGPALPTQDL